MAEAKRMRKTKRLRFAGELLEVDVSSTRVPKGCAGEMKVGRPRRHAEEVGRIGSAAYEAPGSFDLRLWKRIGTVTGDEGEKVLAMRRRKLTILGLLLLAIAVIQLLVWMMFGQNAIKNTIDYVGSATGLIQTNEDVEAEISGYTSFESIPESVSWTAGASEQPIVLKNLEGNDVDLAPRIYVDLDGDGELSDDECVYNEDCSKRIAPGNQLDSVELDKEVPAGTYYAEVRYSAYMEGTDAEANGMTFGFTLTVS